MQTLSLKIPSSLAHEISLASEQMGISKSLLIREAVSQYLQTQPCMKQGSFLEQAADLCGSIKGPKDLASNKDHLEGFGE